VSVQVQLGFEELHSVTVRAGCPNCSVHNIWHFFSITANISLSLSLSSGLYYSLEVPRIGEGGRTTGKCKGLERIWMRALVAKSRGTSKYFGGGDKGTTKMSGKHSPRRDSNCGNFIRHAQNVRATPKCWVISAYAALPFNGKLVRFEPNLDLTNFRTSSSSNYQSSVVEHFDWFPGCDVMTMKSDVIRRSKSHLSLRSTSTFRYDPRDQYYALSTILKQWSQFSVNVGECKGPIVTATVCTVVSELDKCLSLFGDYVEK
jgi:hypothetical protein